MPSMALDGIGKTFRSAIAKCRHCGVYTFKGSQSGRLGGLQGLTVRRREAAVERTWTYLEAAPRAM